MNGLDLFSGIGGIGLALEPWVKVVAYCERDKFARAVILSRIADGSLHNAPIWDDVQTLRGKMLPRIDIIFGGFPCQDISVAGRGAGLAGERSGLVFEIFRLIDECNPTFVFLENVPAIRTRGGETVGKELAARGFDCRWTVISAAEVGAPHLRKRWFMLAKRANGNGNGCEVIEKPDSQESEGQRQSGHDIDRLCNIVPNTYCITMRDKRGEKQHGPQGEGEAIARDDGEKESLEDANGKRLERLWQNETWPTNPFTGSSWWSVEPNVGRVAHGVLHRVDRLRCLGNAVVPLQAQKAFKILLGI